MTSSAKDTWYAALPAPSPVGQPRPSVARPTTVVFRRLLEAGAVGSIVVIGLLANDWIAGVALMTLYVGWKLLRENGPPVIAASFTVQWLQVTSAVIYFALSGRALYQMRNSDYRPMVLIGLASIAALFAGFYLGAGLRRKPSAT